MIVDEKNKDDQDKEKEGEEMTPEEKAEFSEWKKSGKSIQSLKEEEERLRADVVETRKFRRGEKIKDEDDNGGKEKESEKKDGAPDLMGATKVSSKKHALNRFIAAHPEYAPENDPGNVRYNKLKSKFDNFKDDDAITVEDYLELAEDAHKIIAPSPKKEEKKEENEDDGAMGKTFGEKKEKSGPRLTSEELDIAKMVGLTPEAYARQKNRFG